MLPSTSIDEGVFVSDSVLLNLQKFGICFVDSDGQARGWNISNMARIGAKLCQNGFQRIPGVSFFDAEECFSAKVSEPKASLSQIWRGF